MARSTPASCRCGSGWSTTTGLIPPAVAATDPQSGIGALASHIGGVGTFTGPTLVKALAGEDTAYDGDFYKQRSPINVIDKVDVPTFLVSGEFDIFQRGTPLLFERLQKRGVPTKLIIGPWDHLKGSSGAEIGNAGYGSLDELQLRWFDHYVKGVRDTALDSDIAPVTYYEQGTGAWRKTSHWVGSDRTAASYKLSGSASNGTPGALDDRYGEARHRAGAPDSRGRAVHPLHQPVDGRHPRPEPVAQPVPRGQPGQRPSRRHLRLRARDEGGALPGPESLVARR